MHQLSFYIEIKPMAKTGPSSLDDRLNRIEGQIKGIAKMIQEEEEIEKVIIQIKAVSSSIDSLKLELVKVQLKKKMLAELDCVVNLIK
jgi:DNA-binding FrmR family transcriptional regulator